MKSFALIVSGVLVAALAAFSVFERQKVDDLQRQISQIQADKEAWEASSKVEADKLQKRIEDGRQIISQLEEQRKANTKEGARDVAAQDPAAAESGKAEKQDFGSMMKKMFTDPGMKKMMRSTQLMGVKMMYGDLAKELGLTTEQANQVMEILGDRQMALTTQGMKALGGGEEASGTAGEAIKDAAATTEEFNALLENIVGKEGMTQLTQYEKTMADRMQIQQYKQAFSSSGVPLEDGQSQQLLKVMNEERLKQPASPLDAGAKDVGAAMKAMQSEETFNRLMAAQEELNGRVSTRARTILSPDQMVQFQGIQQQQLDMQKMGMEMGRKMMKGN